MSPEQKLKWMVVKQVAEWQKIELPSPITVEKIDEIFHDDDLCDYVAYCIVIKTASLFAFGAVGRKVRIFAFPANYGEIAQW